MDMTGFPDGAPTRVGVAITDYLAGLYAIHRILAVVEWKAADRRAIVAALVAELREQVPQSLRALTTVPGMRDVVYFPFSLLSRLLPERRRRGRGGVGRRWGREHRGLEPDTMP